MSAPANVWQSVLVAGAADLKRARRLLRFLPGAPRCKLCNAPLHGLGRAILQFSGRPPSSLNPKFCSKCQTMAGANLGGADVPMTVLSAESRAWTGTSRPGDLPMLLSRYQRAAARALIGANAFIDKVSDSRIVAAFVPGFAGPDHAAVAAAAAHQLLHETGHAAVQGPWLPLGVGIATGTAHMGAAKEGRATDVSVSGAIVGLADGLSSAARAGETLVNEAAVAAGLRVLERRMVALKDGTHHAGVLRMTAAHI